MSKDDPYTQANPIKPVGGVSWRSDDAAQAAVLNAAALEGPAEIRCELCQVLHLHSYSVYKDNMLSPP